MTENAELREGVSLSSLHAGSVIDLETKNRHYRLEYLGGDKAWISGHPRLCPRPVMVHVEGSIGRSMESGFIGQGMHLMFRRLEDARPVTTSEITSVRVIDKGN
jgi:hypothetical protein